MKKRRGKKKLKHISMPFRGQAGVSPSSSILRNYPTASIVCPKEGFTCGSAHFVKRFLGYVSRFVSPGGPCAKCSLPRGPGNTLALPPGTPSLSELRSGIIYQVLLPSPHHYSTGEGSGVFSREEGSALFSLVDSRQIICVHALLIGCVNFCTTK